MRNTEVLLTQGDGHRPLEYDAKLLGVLSLILVDELDKIAVTVFAKLLVARVLQLTFSLDVVDPDLAHRNHLSAMCIARGL